MIARVPLSNRVTSFKADVLISIAQEIIDFHKTLQMESPHTYLATMSSIRLLEVILKKVGSQQYVTIDDLFQLALRAYRRPTSTEFDISYPSLESYLTQDNSNVFTHLSKYIAFMDADIFKRAYLSQYSPKGVTTIEYFGYVFKELAKFPMLHGNIHLRSVIYDHPECAVSLAHNAIEVFNKAPAFFSKFLYYMRIHPQDAALVGTLYPKLREATFIPDKVKDFVESNLQYIGETYYLYDNLYKTNMLKDLSPIIETAVLNNNPARIVELYAFMRSLVADQRSAACKQLDSFYRNHGMFGTYKPLEEKKAVPSLGVNSQKKY